MTDLRTAAQAALTALEMSAYGEQRMPERDKAMADLLAALAQPEPCIGNNPSCPCQDGDLCHYKDSPDGKTKAMPISAQRKPLSEDEQVKLAREMVKGNKSVEWLVRAVERAHGIG